MANLTKGIGWNLVGMLREAGCTYTSGRSFIEVYNQYTCGCTSFIGYYTLEEFKDDYGMTNVSFSYYLDPWANNPDIAAEAEVYISCDDTCPECISLANRVYCDTCVAPQGFESVTKYHGIAAFNSYGMDSIGDYLVRFQSINANPEWQICCSSRPIGPIGAVIDADVLCASNMDLCTDIDPDNGRRYFDGSRYRATHLVSHANELDSTVWSHDEIVTHNNSIRYIWVYDQASDTIKNYGKFIARTLKVYYVEISNALVVGK